MDHHDGKWEIDNLSVLLTSYWDLDNISPFPGLKSYTGEWYQASNWPEHEVDIEGKRIAIVGTGSTGVHLVPKLAPVAKELTVFQRTPNYVLPGRNHTIDEYQVVDIKKKHDASWAVANSNLAGHAAFSCSWKSSVVRISLW